MKNKQFLIRLVYILMILMGGISLFTPNPLLCLPALIALRLLITLLYKDRFITVFLIAFVYQWVQVSIKPIYANLSFLDIRDLTSFPDEIIRAYLLSCVALVVVAYGVSLSLNKIPQYNEDEISKQVNQVNFNYLFASYWLFSFVITILLFIPALRQAYVLLAGFKWVIFFLLYVYSIKTNGKKIFIYGIIFFEFLTGFISYFADWKTVIFYTIIAWLSVINLKTSKLIKMTICGSAIIFLGLLWTNVKNEYRSYISAGQKQTVQVSNSEAIGKLYSLIIDSDPLDDNKTQKSFLDRMSYIDYFSSCLSYVPNNQPYEDGALTIKAIKHVLLPRFLYKNKEIIDESTHLTKYTGVYYSNYSKGVSFSLGYIGDLYVDYGPIFMFIALFFLGLLSGRIFLSFYEYFEGNIMSYSILILAFGVLSRYELSLIKLIGNLIMTLLVFTMMCKFIIPLYFKNIQKKYI